MGLFFEIKSGLGIGKKFPLKAGFRLGRTTGEILVQDPKISSLHAQIDIDPQGKMVLIDRNSSNGLWIKQERVKSVVLLPGVLFRAGKTTFLVIEEADVVEATSSRTFSQVGDRRVAWKNTLTEGVPLLLAENLTPASNIYPFLPAVCLYFISGAQTDEVVVLGYGPRKFGSTVLDIELQDPQSPFVAFEIWPEQGGNARLITQEYRQVHVNGRQVASEKLREGDVISLGSTQIRVTYMK